MIIDEYVLDKDIEIETSWYTLCNLQRKRAFRPVASFTTQNRIKSAFQIFTQIFSLHQFLQTLSPPHQATYGQPTKLSSRKSFQRLIFFLLTFMFMTYFRKESHLLLAESLPRGSSVAAAVAGGRGAGGPCLSHA